MDTFAIYLAPVFVNGSALSRGVITADKIEVRPPAIPDTATIRRLLGEEGGEA